MDEIDARHRSDLRACARAWREEWRFAEDAYTPSESALWRMVARALRPPSDEAPRAPAAARAPEHEEPTDPEP
jgi:hypothetical protein